MGLPTIGQMVAGNTNSHSALHVRAYIMTWADFVENMLEAGYDQEEAEDMWEDAVSELQDTGSVTIEVGRYKYVVTLNMKRED